MLFRSFNAGYYSASSNAVYDIGTNHFVFEIVGKLAAGVAALISKGSVSPFYAFYTINTTYWYFFQNGTWAAALGVPNGTWGHIMVFGIPGGSTAMYINGVQGTVVGATPADMTNTNTFKIGGANDGDNLAYCAMWKGVSWLDTHLQATVAATRFAQLTNVYPTQSKGTALPVAMSRTGIAYLDK